MTFFSIFTFILKLIQKEKEVLQMGIAEIVGGIVDIIKTIINKFA